MKKSCPLVASVLTATAVFLFAHPAWAGPWDWLKSTKETGEAGVEAVQKALELMQRWENHLAWLSSLIHNPLGIVLGFSAMATLSFAGLSLSSCFWWFTAGKKNLWAGWALCLFLARALVFVMENFARFFDTDLCFLPAAAIGLLFLLAPKVCRDFGSGLQEARRGGWRAMMDFIAANPRQESKEPAPQVPDAAEPAVAAMSPPVVSENLGRASLLV